MDEPPSTPQRPVPASKLSPIPSWVLLGFLLGAGFVWMLMKPSPELRLAPKPVAKAASTLPGGARPLTDAEKAQLAQPPAAPAKPRVPKPRQLSTVEAVFEDYGKNAIWDHDRTEIALWNSDKGSFADFYEVYRHEDLYYFRSIPVLSRPLLALPDQPDVPLVFTETEALRRERLDSLRNLVPAHPMPTETLPKPDVEAPKP